MGRIVLNIPPQPHDEIVDGARVRVLVQAPHLLEHLLSRHRLAFMLDQISKDVHLHQGQRKHLIVAPAIQAHRTRPTCRQTRSDRSNGGFAFAAAPAMGFTDASIGGVNGGITDVSSAGASRLAPELDPAIAEAIAVSSHLCDAASRECERSKWHSSNGFVR